MEQTTTSAEAERLPDALISVKPGRGKLVRSWVIEAGDVVRWVAASCGIISVVQDHCDWCHGPLTDDGRQACIARGLAREDAWACAACLKQGQVSSPPDGWEGEAAEWPFHG